MSIIFYNYPVGTSKLAMVNTEASVADLVSAGVIPSDAATLVTAYPEDTDLEGMAKLTHPDKLVFDDLSNPTAVNFDMDIVDLWWQDVYRACRTTKLEELDTLQTRALGKGLTSVVSDIETDKQTLRDLMASVDFTTATSFVSTTETRPVSLFTDYVEKYRSALA